jgi:hypothetical protein
MRMLTYAGVCWRMLTYADICWRMLTYADVVPKTIGTPQKCEHIKSTEDGGARGNCCFLSIISDKTRARGDDDRCKKVSVWDGKATHTLLPSLWLIQVRPKLHQGCQGAHKLASSRIKSRRDWHSGGSPPAMAHFQKQTVSKAAVNQSVNQK